MVSSRLLCTEGTVAAAHGSVSKYGHCSRLAIHVGGNQSIRHGMRQLLSPWGRILHFESRSGGLDADPRFRAQDMIDPLSPRDA